MVEYENSAVGVAEPKNSQLTVARESPDENVWGIELEPEETASHTHPASSKKKETCARLQEFGKGCQLYTHLHACTQENMHSDA